jgi:serine/threonine protein kinase
MSRPVIGGRYCIERTLGGGGMAVVYAARDDRLDRMVAVKVLAENLAAQPEIRRRFLREARIAAALSHPNIVEIFDSGENGQPYIVMEYVPGPTLAHELHRRGPFAAEDASRIAAEAAAGLGHAHAAGIVHRDVKPENLLLGPGDGVKIADFGIAHALDGTRLTSTGTVLGTAAYLAPEQARGEPVSPATDVYGLGAVLYELLTGRPPHSAATLTELLARKLEDPDPPATLRPAVSPALDALVERCLALDPGMRPTAAEVRDALRGDTETLTRIMQRGPQRLRPRGRVPRGRVAVLAGAVVLGAAALGIAAAVGDAGSGEHRPAPAPRIAPVPPGASPAERARNLSAWLRRYARG